MSSRNDDRDVHLRQRQEMVERQIAARGIDSPPVLEAMRRVPREAFVPPSMREFAYEDAPLPIAESQTISQPYIVALMTDALHLVQGDRVLEVGTGSGYAAAVLGEIAERVHTIERHEQLAAQARAVLAQLGYDNVEVIVGDGSEGWPQAAPYEGIVVAAGGPAVPESLKRQLAVGGRLVIPVGASAQRQSLIRITRVSENEYREEGLGEVRFVPLIGTGGWKDADSRPSDIPGASATPPAAPRRERPSFSDGGRIATAAEAFDRIDDADLTRLLARIGDSRVVLIGEASHGTSEFYRFRARITEALIAQKGFSVVAVEADWPDASRIDHYVRDARTPPAEWSAFTRFPTWMWRNTDVRDFVHWLRDFNLAVDDPGKRVGFYGLDLYSLFTSIEAVLAYLDDIDPDAAAIARERYGCLTPWQSDPATYGRAALSGRYRECEKDVVAMLSALLNKRLEYTTHDGLRFLDAVQNARLIANAERYYRSMYSGYAESWNLRDQHMFDTLQSLLKHGGGETRAVVWAHNSHIGDASATDMTARGQLNIGELCRKTYGNEAYLIGFGTHTGTVAAADDWGEAMEVKTVQPSLEGSWERLCHDAGIPSFSLALREPASRALGRRLQETRLERAIGVIYRPQTERASHYFNARLGAQFDEYIWFDHSKAITPLENKAALGMPDTYPFGV